MQDVLTQRNERYVRWLELFTSYVHELGHMFVAFLHLTYKGCFSSEESTATKLSYVVQKPEAGYVLEHHLFGGILRRHEDESGRTEENMVRKNE